MTKKITSLVKDIYARLNQPKPVEEDSLRSFSSGLTQLLSDTLSRRREGAYLRLSNLGSKCNRKLWYSVHTPELGEPLSGAKRLKFLFGHVIEHLLLFLAREAGHKVTGEQDELVLHGVKGHRDAVIDGQLVDVKSSSTFGMAKFRDHKLDFDDPFGYREQLDGYLHASVADPLVTDKDKASFLAVDKTLGHVVLDTYPKRNKDYQALVKNKQEVLNKVVPPDRAFSDKPEGASGNRKLGLECSYCEYKKTCWPGLRAFKYERKPVFLTHVAREPRVPEIPIHNDEENT